MEGEDRCSALKNALMAQPCTISTANHRSVTDDLNVRKAFFIAHWSSTSLGMLEASSMNWIFCVLLEWTVLFVLDAVSFAFREFIVFVSIELWTERWCAMNAKIVLFEWERLCEQNNWFDNHVGHSSLTALCISFWMKHWSRIKFAFWTNRGRSKWNMSSVDWLCLWAELVRGFGWRKSWWMVTQPFGKSPHEQTPSTRFQELPVYFAFERQYIIRTKPSRRSISAEWKFTKSNLQLRCITFVDDSTRSGLFWQR